MISATPNAAQNLCYYTEGFTSSSPIGAALRYIFRKKKETRGFE